MIKSLERAIAFLQGKPELAGYEIKIVEGELHLSKGGDCFVRLIPPVKDGEWSMKHFHSREGWDLINFSGSLEECLDFLSENPHFLYWET